MATEPTAVTSHDSREIAPTRAMLVGSMMIPDPIMLTATMNVSWTRFIFFGGMQPPRHSSQERSLVDDVRAEPDASIDSLLEDALHFVVETGEAVERFLERQEVVEHRLRAVVPALARQHDADTRRVDQRERRRHAALDVL